MTNFHDLINSFATPLLASVTALGVAYISMLGRNRKGVSHTENLKVETSRPESIAGENKVLDRWIEYANRIEKDNIEFKQQVTAQIEIMKKDHKDEINNLKLSHAREIRDLKESFKKKLDEKNEEIIVLRKRIIDLEDENKIVKP
jgi:hypothetical protein